MDTYADDLSERIETLYLKGAVLKGFSAGDSEVTRDMGRNGTKRVPKAGPICAVPSLMLKTEVNPKCLTMLASLTHLKRIYHNRWSSLNQVALLRMLLMRAISQTNNFVKPQMETLL